MDDIEKTNLVNMVVKETTKAMEHDDDAVFHLTKRQDSGPFFKIKGSQSNLVQGLVTVCLQNKEILELFRYVVFESDRVRSDQTEEFLKTMGKC